MAKTVPLDEQIIATLTGLCKSDQAAAVLADAEDVLRDLTGQADKADVASLNPLATAAEARTHRQKASDARFEADRMEASVAALQSRLADLKDAEAEARRDAARLEAMNARDALAAEIAKEYPRIVATMTDLVKRIDECDELCRQAGIRESAEAIGRDCPANFYVGGGPVTRLRDAHLPMPKGARNAWGSNSIGGDWQWPGLDLAEKAKREAA